MKKLFIMAFAAVALVSVSNVFAIEKSANDNVVVNPADSTVTVPADTTATPASAASTAAE